ncbi:MAG TPA: hypothetical protein VFE84_08235 [Patescibacteria group bacterium]|jgi:hypothetical protein|nr:hypothetical protein [Patescibacteria group bacterium]
MKKRSALVFTLIATGFIVVAAAAAMITPTPAVAGDNPCDPTPNILLNCKATHGHFDSSCCCCVHH